MVVHLQACAQARVLRRLWQQRRQQQQQLVVLMLLLVLRGCLVCRGTALTSRSLSSWARAGLGSLWQQSTGA